MVAVVAHHNRRGHGRDAELVDEELRTEPEPRVADEAHGGEGEDEEVVQKHADIEGPHFPQKLAVGDRDEVSEEETWQFQVFKKLIFESRGKGCNFSAYRLNA